MGHEVRVAYASTTQGMTQQETGATTTYRGKVVKIPKELFGKERQVDLEKDIADLLQEMEYKSLEPAVDDGTIEGYETWDIETGDVWVMYRVPCKEK